MSAEHLDLLFVEDNDIDARIFSAKLRREGGDSLSLARVDSLANALATVTQWRPDAILVDLDLPDSRGLATLEALLGAVHETPVVVLTGEDDESEAIRALKTGAQDFVKKCEFDARIVLRLLRFAAERRAAEIERKELAIRYQNAQRLESLGQLAAGVAHEINTPIQFIGDNTTFVRDSISDLLGWLTALRAAAAEITTTEDAAAFRTRIEEEGIRFDLDYLIDEIPKALEQTLEGVARVGQIVRAMKELAHPGGSDPVHCDVQHLLSATITVTKNAWKYLADVETDFEPDPVEVLCFPGELNQTFLNMLVNATQAIEDAAKHHETGYRGRIGIRVRRQPTGVEIRISDTGCGIPPGIVKRIFDPFFTTKEVGRGTGQGLAIAMRAIVNLHGGSIQVHSVERQGTTFVISLPNEPPQRSATADDGRTKLEPSNVT